MKKQQKADKEEITQEEEQEQPIDYEALFWDLLLEQMETM